MKITKFKFGRYRFWILNSKFRMLNSLFGTLTSECWTLNSEISCISIINHVSVDSHMAQALCFLLARSQTQASQGCHGKDYAGKCSTAVAEQTRTAVAAWTYLQVHGGKCEASPWHPWRFVSGCPGKGDHWVPRGRMESFHTLERLPAHILESFPACLCTSWVKMRRSGEIRSENPQSRWNSAVKLMKAAKSGRPQSRLNQTEWDSAMLGGGLRRHSS